MISTIIFCSVLAISLISFTLLEITRRDDFEVIGEITGIVALALGFVMMTSLLIGYTNDSVTDKEKIEYRLRRGDIIALSEAYEYDERLKRGDNYWCRFTLRDQSEYIDVTEVKE